MCWKPEKGKPESSERRDTLNKKGFGSGWTSHYHRYTSIYSVSGEKLKAQYDKSEDEDKLKRKEKIKDWLLFANKENIRGVE